MKESKKNKYYSLKNILLRQALYYIIFGERSNGKTFAVLEYALIEHINSGYQSQLGIIRRWTEDFKGKNGDEFFKGFIHNKVHGNYISKLTEGKYNDVVYQSKRWYLANIYIDENGKEQKEVNNEPFAIGFSINEGEHYKSLSFPLVDIILFDEFITRERYLNDEFVRFQNLLSTIIRDRDNVTIFMCGNSVNKYCPYYLEMGLRHIKNMKKGDIDLYEFGDSGLKVAVEYSDSPSKEGKASDKYFAFDNPKLRMITSGEWEIDIYPHLPFKYVNNDVKYEYYIFFDNELLHAKIIKKGKDLITYIHRKTTPIKDDFKGLVYQQEYCYKHNYRRKMTKITSPIETFITSFFAKDKVFYQDNEVGEVVQNYLLWCRES